MAFLVHYKTQYHRYFQPAFLLCFLYPIWHGSSRTVVVQCYSLCIEDIKTQYGSCTFQFQSICNKFVFLILLNLPKQTLFFCIFIVFTHPCSSCYLLQRFSFPLHTIFSVLVLLYHCIVNVIFWVTCTYDSIISAVMPWLKNNFTFSHGRLSKWIGYTMNNRGSVQSFLFNVWEKQRLKADKVWNKLLTCI